MRMLMYRENVKIAVEELGKTLSSISLPSNKQTFTKLFQSALKTNLIEYLDLSETTIRNLLKTLHLSYESSNDLQQLLISALTKRKKINQYETRYASTNSKGKEITTISNLRQQIIKLNQKCDIINSTTVDSETLTTEICDNDTINDIQKDTDTNSMELTGISIEVDSNNQDKLTDQVLTLPRKYRPINLKDDHIFQNNNSATDDNISVSTLKIPNLPVIPNNIACATTNYSNKQNKINQMIDLLDQPSYLKKELPSQQLRENSVNLERDNKPKYRRLVSMGYKMIRNVIDTLCPGPSRWHLLNDICVQLAKQTNQLWDDDERTIKTNYTKLVSVLCLCMKMAKMNSVEKKVCRAILYKGTTNRELNKLMREHNFVMMELTR